LGSDRSPVSSYCTQISYQFDPIGAKSDRETSGEQPNELENDLVDSFKANVVGNIHLFNLYMPLILKGREKKVVALSSGLADNNAAIEIGIDVSNSDLNF
jgi:hypothetical protein